MASTRRPIVLLIRVMGPPRWVRYGSYKDAATAQATHRRCIQGRGITAWSWWGPRHVAVRMLRTGESPEEAEMALRRQAREA